ncbi:MAG: glycosyltransferase family A protein [Halobacteriota archaeon]
MSYVLITPIKNEVESLQQLGTSVLNQTLLPRVWVVVDGDSKDRSFDQAKSLFHDYDWISVIRQRSFCEAGNRYKNMSVAINEGYDYAKKKCADNHKNYSYVGKTDATPILEPDYFEALQKALEQDARLAFACGSQRREDGAKVKLSRPLRNLSDMGYNDIRLYRKQFFDEIGGYSLTPSPDAVAQIKASRRGWKYKRVESTCFVDPRPSGTQIGVWAGKKAQGKAMYELGYHPILFLLNALANTIMNSPHCHVIPMSVGYLSSAVRKEERVDDDEIRNYFHAQRLHQVLRDFFTLSQVAGYIRRAGKR